MSARFDVSIALNHIQTKPDCVWLNAQWRLFPLTIILSRASPLLRTAMIVNKLRQLERPPQVRDMLEEKPVCLSF